MRKIRRSLLIEARFDRVAEAEARASGTSVEAWYERECNKAVAAVLAKRTTAVPAARKGKR